MPDPSATEGIRGRTAGQWKQDILRVYNAINQQISGVGVTRQRVDLLDDGFLVVAEHQRIAVLSSIRSFDATLSRFADVAVIDESKRRLRAAWESALGISVRTILKDYDPEAELAATVVILTEPLLIDRHQ